MKYLLDTDHLTILQRQSGPEFASIISHLSLVTNTDVAVAVVSFHEQALGAHTYINRAKTTSDMVRGYRMLNNLFRLYSSANVLPFDDLAATELDKLVTQKVRVRAMDLRIAAIALSNQMCVVTRNQRDFGRVPNLQIENWTK